MKGVYILVISVSKDVTVKVAALGDVNFEKGSYAYVGSAQQGLEKRVKRHLRKAKRKFWHVDYLLNDDAVRVLKVFYKEATKSDECRLATKLGERGIPIADFGCSDCKCISHLFKVDDYSFLKSSMSEMQL